MITSVVIIGKYHLHQVSSDFTGFSKNLRLKYFIYTLAAFSGSASFFSFHRSTALAFRRSFFFILSNDECATSTSPLSNEKPRNSKLSPGFINAILSGFSVSLFSESTFFIYSVSRSRFSSLSVKNIMSSEYLA